MASRGLRRKKSSLQEVKLAVVGAPSVGKSALTVRFLTKRYIGEYDHQQGTSSSSPSTPSSSPPSTSSSSPPSTSSSSSPSTSSSSPSTSSSSPPSTSSSSPPSTSSSLFEHYCKYKHEVLLDGEPILFEILDTCPKSLEELPGSEVAAWADALFLVYSITDRASFTYVRRARQSLQLPPDVPLALVGNKADMVHLRQLLAWGSEVAAGGDALFLVYSITDRASFTYVRRARQSLQLPPDVPLALVGNKADMVHLRQVSGEEGEILAKDFECTFKEVAAAEQVSQVGEVFLEVSREVLALRRRCKHSLLDRMLGNKTARAYARGKSDSALPKE
ncbi:unnamed protein product [Plutella xylostella]|uniref:small monomeric GTPase n=1 Tax=Plutella xylostella TaxID=51655 RepID=A0A8S4GCR4_PLUXY|nr:unnamed protein product [Plutella xylostella]